MVGNLRGDLGCQFQSLLICAHAERLEHRANAITQAEADGLQFKLARLDLGKIQNVIN
jgi:hypothetical protein